MLKYLIIPLADNAVSFCHYNPKVTEGNLIPLDILRKGIFWAMKENLSIQFIFPDRKLPDEYQKVIGSIDHVAIVSSACEDNRAIENADVVVFDSWKEVYNFNFHKDVSYVVRTSMADFVMNTQAVQHLISQINRLVVIITDLDNLKESDVDAYKKVIDELIPVIVKEYERGHSVQLNLLTDRLYLDKMNNCNAGDESITLAPDGRFYICPAFYLDGDRSEGDIESGLSIRNSQLFRLDHAPICRVCDAYQCRRCVWLNRKRTLEINTPGRIQCVVSHIERNASKKLLAEIRKIGDFLPDKDIPELDYIDPFEKITR